MSEDPFRSSRLGHGGAGELVGGDAGAWHETVPAPKTLQRNKAVAAARQSAWLLRQLPGFQDAVLSQSTLVRYSRGDRIIGLEAIGSDLHFLVEGAVQVSIARADLEVVPTHVISPFEWFGEYGAASGRSNIAEYRACMPCSVLVVPRGALQGVVEADARYQLAMTELLTDALRTYLELAGGLTGLESEDRVRSKLYALTGSAHVNRDNAHVLRISQEELAAVSCVSRSVVWKVMAQLTEEGTVESGYRRIVVFHRDRLIAGRS